MHGQRNKTNYIFKRVLTLAF